MFGVRKKVPTRPFTHADDCRIVRADPGVEIPWSEVEAGHWQAVCECGSEDVYEEAADRRARLDPLDPKTSRHAGGCEFALETDPAVLRLVLKIQDGAAAGYSWVQCTSCDTGWPVPRHAAESVG